MAHASPFARTRVLFTALAAIALGACAAAPSDSGDANDDLAVASVTAADSTCAHLVLRKSSDSWLITYPRIVNVYWGQFWNSGTGASTRAELDAFWSGTANNPAYWNRIAEYGIHGGSYGGSHVLATPIVDNPAGNIVFSIADIEHVMKIMAEDGELPRTDNNDLFVIYLPERFAVSCGCGAYHGSFYDKAGKPVWYAVQNYYTPNWIDETTSETSHEIVEAATDPDGAHGYRDTLGSHGEIGDICESSALQYKFGAHNVQAVWSQSRCACYQGPATLPPPPPPPPPSDPCMSRPPAQRLCCHKPSLPVCRNPG